MESFSPQCLKLQWFRFCNLENSLWILCWILIFFELKVDEFSKKNKWEIVGVYHAAELLESGDEIDKASIDGAIVQIADKIRSFFSSACLLRVSIFSLNNIFQWYIYNRVLFVEVMNSKINPKPNDIAIQVLEVTEWERKIRMFDCLGFVLRCGVNKEMNGNVNVRITSLNMKQKIHPNCCNSTSLKNFTSNSVILTIIWMTFLKIGPTRNFFLFPNTNDNYSLRLSLKQQRDRTC